MKTLRYLAAMVIAVSFALPATAATGPWSWTDISSKIPVKRDGWNVKAVGRFQGEWYFTNGLDFAKGGKVWKIGAQDKVMEITGSLKKAGLARVDRIGSMGDHIAYYQDLGKGKEAKVVVWDGFDVGLIAGYEKELNTLLADTDALVKDIPAVHLKAMQAQSMLAAGGQTAAGKTTILHYTTLTDGTYASAQTLDLSDKLSSVPNAKWNGALAAWNGKSWMVIINHDLVRFDGKELAYLGRVRDKFSSITSMADGSFLLGGATTDKKPKAKLVLVKELLTDEQPTPTGTINSAPALPATTSSTTTTVQATTFLWSVKPMDLINGKRTINSSVDGSYGVTANNAGGLKKLELLVNGNVNGTCDAGGETEVYCKLTLKAADYAAGTQLNLAARATDNKDAATEGANEVVWTE